MATPMGNICPTGAIQSFPVGVSFTITPELLDSIFEPLQFKFTWESRTTVPQFTGSESGAIRESQNNYVEFGGRSYSLYSLQLSNPTHQKWVTPYTEQVKNEEDLIFTFAYSDLLIDEPQYIIFVIPILRSQTPVGDPEYLINFGDPAKAGNSISLQTLIPSRSREPFAYYRTCAQGYTQNAPAQNILAVISTQGLYVSAERMIRIKRIFEQAAVRTDYGPYIFPATLSFTMPFRFTTPELFKERVKITRDILTPTTAGTQPGGPLPIAEISTTNFQCVPLDPDKQINKNGGIQIDPNTGKPLSTLEAEREAEKKDIFEAKSKIPEAVFTRYVSAALGIFFVCIIFGVIIFFLLGALVGTAAVGDGATFWQRAWHRMKRVPAYSVIGILAGFIGFTIGMLLKYN